MRSNATCLRTPSSILLYVYVQVGMKDFAGIKLLHSLLRLALDELFRIAFKRVSNIILTIVMRDP